MKSLRFWVCRVALVLVLFSCMSSNVAAWWEKGHRIATECAVEVLPEEVPAFLREQKEILKYLSGEADRWKRYGPTLRAAERPNHYMDLEMLNEEVSEIAFPSDRYKALRGYFEKGEKIPGLLFYQIMEYYERLRGSFHEYRARPEDPGVRHAIVSYAGILAHYAEDLSQPLHLTIHYDGRVNARGKVVGNKGIHKRFEGPMVEQYVEVEDCRKFMRTPLVFKNVAEAVKKAMLTSHGFVDEVYRQDDAGKFEKPDRASKTLVRARLAFGAQFLADLWYTAWAHSAEETE